MCHLHIECSNYQTHLQPTYSLYNFSSNTILPKVESILMLQFHLIHPYRWYLIILHLAGCGTYNVFPRIPILFSGPQTLVNMRSIMYEYIKETHNLSSEEWYLKWVAYKFYRANLYDMQSKFVQPNTCTYKYKTSLI